MTTVEYEVSFDLVEMDLLATHAGVRWPFPLRVPSFGRYASERDELLAEAGQGLLVRGLATEHGPLGMAAELVTALQEYRGAVDLVVVGEGTVTGAVAMVYDDWAVVCHQDLDGGSTVRATRVGAEELSGELTGLIPEHRAAQFMPATLPPGAGLDQLKDLFPVRGQGQLGVVIRHGGRGEVSWLDSARGRIRVDAGSDGWVSVNPMRHNELLRAVNEAAAVARR